MLWFERQVVTTLTATLDERLRAEIEDYVDGALRVMPEHLRAGMAAESLALGAWSRLRGGSHPSAPGTSLDRLESSRLDPVRQYVRLLRSLVLFAEHELGPTGSAGREPGTTGPEGREPGPAGPEGHEHRATAGA
jgi:hypothetical protein